MCIVFTNNVRTCVLYLSTMYVHMYCIYQQCTYMCIVFILQCQNVCKARKSVGSNRFQWCPLPRPYLYCYCFLSSFGMHKVLAILCLGQWLLIGKNIPSMQFDGSNRISSGEMYLSQPRFCTYPMPEHGFRSANVALMFFFCVQWFEVRDCCSLCSYC